MGKWDCHACGSSVPREEAEFKDGKLYHRACKERDDAKGRIVNYSVLWDEHALVLNPALDFVGNKAYLTTYLWTLRSVKRKRKPKAGEDGEHDIVERKVLMPHVITSEREIIPLDEERLDELPFIPSSIPQRLKNRGWTPSEVRKFIDDEDEAPTFKDVFNDIREVFEYNMDYYDPRYYSYKAVWAIATWFHPLFNTFPELYLNAAKRSGKTKTLNLLAEVCFNGKLVLDPSNSTMFRLTQNNRCTILIDEVKRLRGPTEENLKTIIRAKYKKGTSVPRAEEKKSGKGFEVNDYELYGPLAMANIKGLEDDMEDRTHTINLRRTTTDKGNREVEPTDPRYQQIRDKMHRLVLARGSDVQDSRDAIGQLIENRKARVEVDSFSNTLLLENIKVKEGQEAILEKNTLPPNLTIYLPRLSTSLTNRSLELARPLLTIASLISEEVVADITSLLVDLSKMQNSEEQAEGFELQVIKVMVGLVAGREAREIDSYIRISEISESLKKLFYPNGTDERSLSIRTGNTLKTLGIYTDKRLVKGHKQIRTSEELVRQIAQSQGVDWDAAVKECGQLDESDGGPIVESEIDLSGGGVDAVKGA